MRSGSFDATPAFTLTAVLRSPLASARPQACTSIYNAVLLKPLPFDHPERLSPSWFSSRPAASSASPEATLTAVRALPAVDRAAVTIGSERTLLDGGDPELVRGAAVTGEFFAVFGVPAAIGRALTSAIHLARRSGGSQSSAVATPFPGRSRHCRPEAAFRRAVHAVVGVMPASFRYPDDADYWAPYTIDATDLASFGVGPFTGIARLERDDITAASAQAAVLGALPAGGTERGPKVCWSRSSSDGGFYRSTHLAVRRGHDGAADLLLQRGQSSARAGHGTRTGIGDSRSDRCDAVATAAATGR